MLFSTNILEKTIGTKRLFTELSLHVTDNEKVALIGRNGVGKTTLFNMLAGSDSDFKGDVTGRRGLSMVVTAQEHRVEPSVTTREYILSNLPEFTNLKHIIDTYPDTMGENLNKIHDYTEALNRFTELNYFNVENQISQALMAYQLPAQVLDRPFQSLSGGQKRFVELIKVMVANADVALIDEPTNHMDYVAKQAFIDWLSNVDHAVIVISHDRDVLHVVDRIVEIKDRKAHSFTGNYDAYLKQNSTTTVTAMNQYEVAQRSIENIKKQIQYARSKKAGWSGTADKKNPFVVMETRLTKDLKRLQTEVEKPSVWIDRESVAGMRSKESDRYEKYKDKNIRIGTNSGESRQTQIVEVSDVSLGYNGPLFENVNFRLSHGDRVQLRGRNGAGKTTLIQTILAEVEDRELPATSYSGHITVNPRLRVGVYEQEIDHRYLDLTLADAITQAYSVVDRRITDQQLRQILASYLFDPQADKETPLSRLSGGQKARFQIINMLASQPDLLILDEPTNHLDLPSIEELEDALGRYTGAVLFVSHDSYFCKNIGGETIEIVPPNLT